jgi:RimJ/RimL family protein N-acetyltransferase
MIHGLVKLLSDVISFIMNIVIETKRLLLRTFTINDAQLIFDLNKDPEVTRYTLDPVYNLEQANEVLEKVILPQYALNNHGRWAVHIKYDLEFIGWCGLKLRPVNEIDLGYRFKRNSWGKGYATEAAFASIKYGFETLYLDRIVGRAMPANTASWKVLEKLGMQFVKEEMVDAHPARTYEIYNPLIRQEPLLAIPFI